MVISIVNPFYCFIIKKCTDGNRGEKHINVANYFYLWHYVICETNIAQRIKSYLYTTKTAP